MHRKGARAQLYARRECRGPDSIIAGMDEIRKAAAKRGRDMGLSYSGALTPAEAQAMMKAGAKLVDVRTKPELQYVGSIPGAAAVEWQTWPGGKPNTEFLEQLAAVAPKEQPVMFLCRSGARSHAAAEAATRAGWKEAYNILEGFEGDKDASGHRSTVGGWRKAGLPWVQS
jgi:rhodanese-related sulfurtransferase